MDARRLVLNSALTAIGAAACVLAVPAFAQEEEWTPEQLTIVIPHSIGGGQDTTTRALGEAWAKQLGTTVVFENRPGASGRIGQEYFLTTPRDGTHVMSSNLASASIMYAQTQPEWDYEEEMMPIGVFAIDPGAIFTSRDSGIESLEQLVEMAQDDPMLFGIALWQSPDNILMHQIMEQTGAQFEIAPYESGMGIVTQIMAGTAAAGYSKIASIERGDMRTLAVSLPSNPVPEMTDNAPTIDEALGIATLPVASYRAISVHRDLAEQHPERLERLVSTFEQAKQDPTYVAEAERLGVAPQFITVMNTDELMKVIRRYWDAYESYGDLIEE